MIIFQSGFESTTRLKKLLKMLENGFRMKGILVSYFNLTSGSLEVLKEIKKYGVKVMLDSGAHSILYAYFKETGKVNVDMGHEASAKAVRILKEGRLDEYAKELIDFVENNSDLFDIYVELDLQQVVGQEKVELWREMWYERGLEPMYVWHGESLEEVKKWLKKTRFIGMGGTGKSSDLERRYTFARKIRKLREDVFIHVFAETKWDNLKRVAGFIDSVDSTSWCSASRFGEVYLWRPGHLWSERYKNNMKFRSMVKKEREILEKIGLDVEKILEGNAYEIDFYSLYSFSKAEEWLSKKDKIKEVVKDLERLGEEPEPEMKGKIHEKKSFKASRLRHFMCDYCMLAEQCPAFQAGAICFLEKRRIKKFGTRDIVKIVEKYVEELADLKARLERAKWFEMVEGGALDKQVTKLQEMYLKALAELDRIVNPEKYKVKVEAKQNVLQLQQNIQNILISEEILKKYEEVMKRWKEWKERLMKKRQLIV